MDVDWTAGGLMGEAGVGEEPTVVPVAGAVSVTLAVAARAREACVPVVWRPAVLEVCVPCFSFTRPT